VPSVFSAGGERNDILAPRNRDRTSLKPRLCCTAGSERSSALVQPETLKGCSGGTHFHQRGSIVASALTHSAEAQSQLSRFVGHLEACPSVDRDLQLVYCELLESRWKSLSIVPYQALRGSLQRSGM
jgi:hypothetical protein